MHSSALTDESGAAVPGAAVTVTQVETNQSRNVVTGEADSYNVPNLASGTYEIVGSSLHLLPIVAKNPGVMRAGRQPDASDFTLQGELRSLVQKSDGIGPVANPVTLRLQRAE